MRIRTLFVLALLVALTVAALPSTAVMAVEIGAEELPVRLEGDGLIVVIESADRETGSLRGRLVLNGEEFPFTAGSLATGTSEGSFEARGKRFPFTLTTRDGKAFLLKSGGKTYTLKREAEPAVTVPGGEAAGTPANPQPEKQEPGQAVPGLPSGFEGEKDGSLGPYTRQFSKVHSLLSGMPAVRKLTAPDWVKPGVKITFWSGSAIIQDQAGQSTLTPDPNGRLMVDGKKYRQSWVAGGSGGVGFTQIDIVGVSKDIVVMQTSSFLHDGSVEAPTLMTVVPFTCHTSGCDWWIHPSALRMLAQQGTFAMPGKWTTNGQLRDVFLVRDGAGSTVYDAETGILLSWSNQVKNTGTETYYDPATQTAQVRPKTGSTLAVNQFRSVRTTYRSELAGMPLPATALSFKGLEARLDKTMDMQVGMGPSPVEGFTARLERVLEKGNWLVIKLTRLSMSTSGMAVPLREQRSVLLITTPAAIGSSFLPTEYLQGLKQGQVLDRDPVTGYTVGVSQVGQDGNGRPMVAITRGGPIEQTTYYYDAKSGVMVSSDKIDRGASVIQRTIVQVTKIW
jgi:hypothetical protein